MNTTQYTFQEWLLINPADEDNNAPCVFCRGTGYNYNDNLERYIDCKPCNNTGRQAVADTYDAYLTQALRDAKAIYDYETSEKRREYSERKTKLQFERDAMLRAKREAKS